jgi:hypothetical protein
MIKEIFKSARALALSAMAVTGASAAAPEAKAAEAQNAYEVIFYPGSKLAKDSSNNVMTNYGLDATLLRVASFAQCVQDVHAAGSTFVNADCISVDLKTMETWYNGDSIGLTQYGTGIQSFGLDIINVPATIGPVVGIFNSNGRSDYRAATLTGFANLDACETAAKQFVQGQYFAYPNLDHAGCVTNNPTTGNATRYATAYLAVPRGGVGVAPLEYVGHNTDAPTVPVFAPGVIDPPPPRPAG